MKGDTVIHLPRSFVLWLFLLIQLAGRSSIALPKMGVCLEQVYPIINNKIIILFCELILYYLILVLFFVTIILVAQGQPHTVLLSPFFLGVSFCLL